MGDPFSYFQYVDSLIDLVGGHENSYFENSLSKKRLNRNCNINTNSIYNGE